MKNLDEFLAVLRAHGVRRYQGPTLTFGGDVIVEFGPETVEVPVAAGEKAGGETINLDDGAPDLTRDPAEAIRTRNQHKDAPA